jgi:hypothetical protein
VKLYSTKQFVTQIYDGTHTCGKCVTADATYSADVLAEFQEDAQQMSPTAMCLRLILKASKSNSCMNVLNDVIHNSFSPAIVGRLFK